MATTYDQIQSGIDNNIRTKVDVNSINPVILANQLQALADFTYQNGDYIMFIVGSSEFPGPADDSDEYDNVLMYKRKILFLTTNGGLMLPGYHYKRQYNGEDNINGSKIKLLNGFKFLDMDGYLIILF